eukprot:scaffold105327_cov69-Phaeocystis_antarctica.AAC.7
MLSVFYHEHEARKTTYLIGVSSTAQGSYPLRREQPIRFPRSRWGGCTLRRIENGVHLSVADGDAQRERARQGSTEQQNAEHERAPEAEVHEQHDHHDHVERYPEDGVHTRSHLLGHVAGLDGGKERHVHSDDGLVQQKAQEAESLAPVCSGVAARVQHPRNGKGDNSECRDRHQHSAGLQATLLAGSTHDDGEGAGADHVGEHEAREYDTERGRPVLCGEGRGPLENERVHRCLDQRGDHHQ